MRMKTKDSEKDLLKDNLKKAVKNCQKLKVGNHQLEYSFKLSLHDFTDFTDDKYEDGRHSYRMNSSIKIENKDGDIIEESCEIHFDARIDGTKVEIENDLIIADRNIIPMNWEYK